MNVTKKESDKSVWRAIDGVRSQDTIASRTRSSRNPRGRLLSDEQLKFCSDGELDHIYDIDIPETIQQITPLEDERFAMCRAIKLCGTAVLEKTIVK
jgi:hypothetical protein